MLMFPSFRAAIGRFHDLHAFISCRSHSTIAKGHCSATRLHINCMFCRKFSDRSFSKYIQTLSSDQTKCCSHLFSSKLPKSDLETQLKLDTAYCRQTFHTYSYLRTVNKENLSLHTRDVHEYIDSPDTAVMEMLKDDFIVYDDFITEEEENSIFQEIEPYLNRLKYEHNHWDDVSVLSLY